MSIRLLRIVFVGGLFLMPFVFWPYGFIRFELPRVWFVWRWIELLGIIGSSVLLFYPKESKEHTFKSHRGLHILLLYVSIAGISSLVGVDVSKSIWGNPYRWDGLFTLTHLIGFAFIVAFFFQKSWIKLSTQAVAASVMGVSICTLVEAMQAFFPGDTDHSLWDGALGATFGQPNFLAGYLAVALPFMWYFLTVVKKEMSSISKIFCLLIIAVAILLTKSWGGIVSVGIFFILLYLFPKNRRIHAQNLFPLYRIVVGIAMILFVFFLYRTTHPSNTFIAESRERIVVKLLLAIQKRPLLGWGWANVDYAFRSSDWPKPMEHDVNLDKAHSTILESFVTMGVVGGVSYITLLFWVGRRLYTLYLRSSSSKLWYRALFFSFILFTIHSQMNVISIAEELVFWFATGIALGSSEAQINPRS